MEESMATMHVQNSINRARGQGISEVFAQSELTDPVASMESILGPVSPAGKLG